MDKIIIKHAPIYWKDHLLIINGKAKCDFGFFEVKDEQLYIYEDTGSSGTGRHKGKLIRSIPLKGKEFIYEEITHEEHKYSFEYK